MNKKYLFSIICIILLLSSFPIINVDFRPVSARNVKQSCVVIEAESGRVLSGNNQDLQMEMASTTKIVTAYLAVKSGDLDRSITITPEMCGVEGSSIYLKTGQVWTLRQLLYGLMLRSGNDAAVAVAITVSGSVSAFVEQMNAFAASLNLTNTHFENPHGLHSEKHYTTAKELAIIAAIAMKNEDFRTIVSEKSYSYVRPDGEKGVFANKNKFLTLYEGGCGIKTGFTKVSGRCLVSAAEREGMLLIGVVLNEPNMWQYSAEQFDLAFTNYKNYSLLGGRCFFILENEGRSFTVGTKTAITYPLTAGEFTSLTYELDWVEQDLPYDYDREIGKVSVYLEKQLLFSEKLYIINKE